MEPIPPVSQFSATHECAIHIENTAFYMIKSEQKPFDPETPRGMVRQIVYHTPHTHAYCELFVCIQGHVVLQCSDYQITLEKNDLALIPPGVLHVKLPNTEGHDADVWRCIGFVCVKRRGARHRDLYSLLHPLCTGHKPILVRDAPDLTATAAGIVDAQASAIDTNHRLLSALRTVELLTQFALQSKAQTEIAPLPTMQIKDIQRAAALENLITSQFMYELDTDHVAQMLYISPRQLERIVKARYGTTLREAITNMRVRTAAHMLLESDIALDQIASAVGFSSRGTFERNFVKAYGVTPLKYRKVGGKGTE